MVQTENAQAICPLCGGDNQCAIAAGKPAESCWCQEATISKTALAALPEDAVNTICICAACGRPTQDDAEKAGGDSAG